MIPAFTLSFLTTVVVSLLTKPVPKEVEQEFDQMKRITADRGGGDLRAETGNLFS